MRKLKESSRKQKKAGPPFGFERLPVELKHEVLTKLKTEFLVEVCSKVSRQWEEMVSDIVSIRVAKVDQIVPAHTRIELEKQILPHAQKASVELLKIYERSRLRKSFDVTAIQVNDDALKSGKEIVFELYRSRPCDCPVIDECIVRSVGIMNLMSLLIAQGATGLQFYNLKDLERLNDPETARDLSPYDYIDSSTNLSHTCPGNSSTTDISVFRDQVAVEEGSRTILLIKVTSVEHENRRLTLQRLRRIHLPLWSRSLCLLEDKLFVVYTTGHIGKWYKNEDVLTISDTAIIGRLTEDSMLHKTKMFRVANLVCIKIHRNNACEWYVHDPENKDVTFNIVTMPPYVTRAMLAEDPMWECIEVFYIDLWCNFFIVHCQVQSLIPTNKINIENRLLIKRVKRSPTLTDFLDGGAFLEDFIVGPFAERTGSTILNGSVISPFLPRSLKPWQLEPHIVEPIPVVDMVAIEGWPNRERKKQRKLRVHRVRISNLPLKQRRP